MSALELCLYFVCPLVIFGLLASALARLREADSSWSHFQRAHPLPATPFQCPPSRTATLELGSRGSYLPLRRPDCTLRRLCAVEHDRPVTQSIDSDPGAIFEDDLHSHHTREPTVWSRVSCRPSHLNIDRFHQPCLLPGRTSRTEEDGHHCTTWRPLTLAGNRILPPLRLTGGFWHAD